ncbi:MAG: glycosyl hydrolase family 17 [Candidatus Krumholzibacteriota bacterium]|nr:glycosyl hydrolase family 17 [Candidatus Krumholzibacteriota bacterium]
MRPHVRTSFLIAPLLLTALAGCGGGTGAVPPAREDPFAVRPFRPESGGRWIGNAVCYGPHRDGQRPGGPSPTAAELREDLRLMLPHWNLLRVYGASEFADTLLAVIRDEGLAMKVMLGVWIAPDAAAANRREADAAIRLAAAYPEIVLAVSVGNETQVSWSAHRSPLDSLIASVRYVRTKVAVPVTVADDFAFWKEPASRALAAEIDFITMHAHPMWNGRLLDDALPWLEEQVSAVRAAHPGRAVVVGETGWATSVHDEGEQAALIRGRPGEGEQKRYHDAARAWAADRGLTVFFFEAFDENWKGGAHPAEVEKHWGLFRADRSPKAAVAPAADG